MAIAKPFVQAGEADAPRVRGRMLSLDVYRGLTVGGMILVTNPGSWDFVYWPLKHADWNGCTPTDMIFPSFLFIAGVSFVFSIAARERRGEAVARTAFHLAWRCALLIVVGVLVNGFPVYDWATIRLPGILQRIALCSAGAGFFYLWLCTHEVRWQRRALGLAAAIAALLAVYWAMMRFVPVPGRGAGGLGRADNLEGYVDRVVLGSDHLWLYGNRLWDPEGLLSTLPATANMLLGMLAGEWLRREQGMRRALSGMALVGVLLVIAGFLLNPVIPINKKIWTPSFMLLSGGVSLMLLAGLSAVIDRPVLARRDQEQWWLLPALVLGTNAILAFVLANTLAPLENMLQFHGIGGQIQTIHSSVFRLLLRGMSPYNASLGYALLFVGFHCALLWFLYRRRIFLRL